MVEAVEERGPADDGPAQDPAEPEFMGDGVGQGALSGAGAAGDQQRAPQVQRRVDHFEFFGAGPMEFGDVPVATETPGGGPVRPVARGTAVAGVRGLAGSEVPPGRRGRQLFDAVVRFAGPSVDEPLTGFTHSVFLVVTRPPGPV
ncbi:hypothetical protein GCM10018966_010320 [Streptomyces yanii]